MVKGKWNRRSPMHLTAQRGWWAGPSDSDSQLMTRPRWAHVWFNKASVLTCGTPPVCRGAGVGGGAAEGGGAVAEV